MNRISISGCGWLGLPLAKLLIENNFVVKGSTTTSDKLQQLSAEGIKPYLINLFENKSADKTFFETDLLIVTLPPSQKKQTEQDYIDALEFLINQTSPSTKIIYTSSTSIYKNKNEELNENVIQSIEDSDYALLYNAEKLFINSGRMYSIVRFGGLTGADRILIKYFAGKTGLTFGNEPVNLIHQQDAARVILEIIKQGKWNTIYNACAPEHPLKKDFYRYLAETYSYQMPEFINQQEVKPVKIISSQKLINELGFRFIYKDPFTFTYTR